MRERINQSVKDAMKAGDKPRLATLRMLTSALKDRELGIGPGAAAGGGEISEADIVQVVQRMVKQRRDSIQQYQAGGRQDLADKEQAEIDVLEEFLPRQMDEAEMRAAIAEAIAETGADSPRDMGKVMGLLKQRHAATMDFGKASGLVKSLLS